MLQTATTIPRLLRAAGHAFGWQRAIEFEEGGKTLSYAELEALASRAARAFLAAGISVGDRVAIWAPNHPHWVIAALGLQSIGGVLVPMNTRYKAKEAGHILKASGAKLLCTVGEFLGTDYVGMLQAEFGGAEAGRPVAGLKNLETMVCLSGSRAGTSDWDAFLAAGETVPPARVEACASALEPEALSDILFTSGTTGEPKGVMTTHRQNLQAFAAWTELVGLREGDRYLVVNPFFHAFGYKAGWLSCLMRGATILPHAVFDPLRVMERVAAEAVTVLPGPPALYEAMLAARQDSPADLSTLRLAVTGAAVVPVDLIVRMKKELGFETVITGYGLTEACGIVTMCRHDDDAETIATTCGKAIPGVEVAVVDEVGASLPQDSVGEVVVRGYNVMQGYFGSEEQPQALGADGWLHTGDLGVLNERGYLRITDRKKDMYIMGGFNCYPAEIETLMVGHEAIDQVAVIGVPDAKMGEVGMAYVVLRKGAVPLTVSQLVAWCRSQMANYKVPRHVEFIAELPRNTLGKVTKEVLRAMARQQRRIAS